MRDRVIGFNITFTPCYDHASGLTAAAEIRPKEFQNQQAVPIKSLAFSPVDGRLHPVSGSMHKPHLDKEPTGSATKSPFPAMIDKKLHS